MASGPNWPERARQLYRRISPILNDGELATVASFLEEAYREGQRDAERPDPYELREVGGQPSGRRVFTMG